MNKYLGELCPICNQKITENDVVSVCPDCGAPYHKDCIAVSKQCANADKHSSDFKWEPNNTPPETQALLNQAVGTMEQIRCPRCGTVSTSSKEYCDVCGTFLPSYRNAISPPQGNTPAPDTTPENNKTTPPFNINFLKENPFTTPFGGVNPDEQIDGVAVKDIAIFVGEKPEYFIPRFKSMQRNKRVRAINFVPFFLDFWYLLYRKMWSLAALFFGLFLATTTAQLFLTNIINNSLSAPAYLNFLSSLVWVISMGTKFYLALQVNSLYKKFVIRKIKRIKSEVYVKDSKLSPEQQSKQYNSHLSKTGGVSRNAILLAISAYMLILMLLSTFANTLLAEIFSNIMSR